MTEQSIRTLDRGRFYQRYCFYWHGRRNRERGVGARHSEATGFGWVWPLTAWRRGTYSRRMNTQYLAEYDGISKTIQMYIDGSRQGKSELMRPAFHPDASFFGYAGGQLAVGPAFLFDWVDKNGPAPKIEPRIASVDILDSIAVVRLEVEGWSGKLAGSDVRMSDLFTLLKTPSGWRIIQKAFHWHA